MTEFESDSPSAPPTVAWVSFVKKYRKPFFFTGLAWFGLVLGSGIFLSTLDARSGLHVFGSEIWQAGQTSVLRVSLRELRLNQSKPMKSVTGVFVDSLDRTIPSLRTDPGRGAVSAGQCTRPRTTWGLSHRADSNG